VAYAFSDDIKAIDLGYYGSTHTMQIWSVKNRSFAHCSLRILNVETLHCVVSQRLKVVPAATVGVESQEYTFQEYTSDFRTCRHSENKTFQ